MYAVIVSGGKQHRVKEGETLKLEKLEVETGGNVEGHRQWFTEVKITGIQG